MTTYKKDRKYRFGINWGSESKITSQDLDLRLSFLNKEGEKTLADVYFGHHEVPGVKFLQDDKIGDIGGDDKMFNEGVVIDFGKLTTNVEKIVFKVSKEKGDIIKGALSHLSLIIREIESNEVFHTIDLLSSETSLEEVLVLSCGVDW